MTENKAKTAVTAAMIQTAMNDMPRIIQMAEFTAKVEKVNYEARIKAGFNEQQALYLCKQESNKKQ